MMCDVERVDAGRIRGGSGRLAIELPVAVVRPLRVLVLPVRR